MIGFFLDPLLSHPVDKLFRPQYRRADHMLQRISCCSSANLPYEFPISLTCLLLVSADLAQYPFSLYPIPPCSLPCIVLITAPRVQERVLHHISPHRIKMDVSG